MEKIQSNIRSIYKYIAFVLLLLVYFFVGTIIYVTSKTVVERRRRFTKLANASARFCLWFGRIKVNVINPPPADEVCLLVGNHLGFIDILSAQAVGPLCFVTSREMHETPVLGLITEMGGCLYVDRRSRINILNEMQEMATEMKKGFRVILYPEATSTNGEQVLPFKKTLMMAAAYAECPIRPFVFNFKKVNGGPVEYKHRDSLCWYGDQTFPPAIWRAFSLASIDVEIEFLEPIYPKEGDDRTEITEKAYQQIKAKFIPFVKPA